MYLQLAKKITLFFSILVFLLQQHCHANKLPNLNETMITSMIANYKNMASYEDGVTKIYDAVPMSIIFYIGSGALLAAACFFPGNLGMQLSCIALGLTILYIGVMIHSSFPPCLEFDNKGIKFYGQSPEIEWKNIAIELYKEFPRTIKDSIYLSIFEGNKWLTIFNKETRDSMEFEKNDLPIPLESIAKIIKLYKKAASSNELSVGW